MGSPLSYAAGGAATSLEDMLKQKFLEQIQRAKLAEDQRQADMQNAVSQRQLGQGDRRLGLDERQFDAGAPLRQANVAHVGAETDSLNRAPGEAEKARTFTAGESEKGRTFTGGQGDLNRGNAVKLANISGQNALRVANARPPALITMQTTDANGNAVTKIVPKEAGAEYAKPKGANAALENRLASARVVNQVGDSMIQKLSDPAFATVVGPAMGRAGTLRDFIGNPPPEFSELAGQIESYALANMGVHGMRSAQGAEHIKRLLDQHHTPQSLAATIRGLNEFSTRLVKDSEPNGGGSADTGPKRVRYDMNGNLIKD